MAHSQAGGAGSALAHALAAAADALVASRAGAARRARRRRLAHDAFVRPRRTGCALAVVIALAAASVRANRAADALSSSHRERGLFVFLCGASDGSLMRKCSAAAA